MREVWGTGTEIAAFGSVTGDCCFYFVIVVYKHLSYIFIDDFPTLFMYLSSFFLVLLLCSVTHGK